MAVPRSVFSVRSLLVSVAFVALFMAAYRTESFSGVMVACMICLACKRTTDVLARRSTDGVPTSRWQRVGIVVTSSTTAVAIIGLADLAFLLGYYGFLRLEEATHRESHYTPYRDLSIAGLFIGGVLALVTTSRLRAVLGMTRSGSRRIWPRLWPLAVIWLSGLWWGAVEMQERVQFCRMMVSYHAEHERTAKDVRTASRHAWLKRWFGHTTWRPWLPIHPDELPRGLFRP
jgi:hypothetical protein